MQTKIVNGRKVYSGFITSLEPNQVFVFGANPEGRHGAGAAKVAMKFGAKYGETGWIGQTYGIVTKNLTPMFRDKNGILYKIAGERSIPLVDIMKDFMALCYIANENKDKEFLIAYSKGGKNLNGYSDSEMARAFRVPHIPENIVFEEGFSELVFDKTQN